jgi:hypothetical protein
MVQSIEAGDGQMMRDRQTDRQRERETSEECDGEDEVS